MVPSSFSGLSEMGTNPFGKKTKKRVGEVFSRPARLDGWSVGPLTRTICFFGCARKHDTKTYSTIVEKKTFLQLFWNSYWWWSNLCDEHGWTISLNWCARLMRHQYVQANMYIPNVNLSSLISPIKKLWFVFNQDCSICVICQVLYFYFKNHHITCIEWDH